MNALVNFANSTADRWMVWMLAASLDATVLLALVSLVWLTIRRRVAPQVGYCLFLLVPLKLLLPVSLTVPMAFAGWTPSAFVSAWVNEAHGEETVVNHRPAAMPTSHIGVESSGRLPRLHETSTEPQPAGAGRNQTGDSPKGRSPAASESRRLSISAMVMIGWLAGVLCLAARFARTQQRFRARLAGLVPIDESQLAVNMPELCRLAGVTQAIRILESDEVRAPAVWGIFQPAIILPHGIVSSLRPAQLRWVLLHELAHIRRRDLLVVVLERAVAMLHFFNPSLWMANRVVDRLREYVCDDLAVSQGEGSVVEFGQAFVAVLRYANRQRRALAGALGVFGLDSKASCTHRVRRLLDEKRTIRIRPGAWSICGLSVLAVVLLPNWRAGNVAAEPEAPPVAEQRTVENQPPPDVQVPLARDTKQFELSIVGPDGNPVSEASVELRSDRAPTAEQIKVGTFVRGGTYGTFATSDTQGQLVVELPNTPERFTVFIQTPSYGPYWAGWSSESFRQPIPARFIAELEPAWSVGGVVVDADGNPVEGAKISPSVRFKSRPGDLRELHVGNERTTDAAGKWRYDCVPNSKSDVSVAISHSDFMPFRQPLSRSRFGIVPGGEPTTRIPLDRGLTVVGRVTDEEGRPIVGALIRAKFANDIRSATTLEDGSYQLAGCEPRTTKIVVSAKGRATDMQELLIEGEMEPVDFQMKPGGKIRIRVLDEHDKPVPKARIFFQRWRGPHFNYFEFDHVSQYADKNGVWEWNEAPLDGFEADICRPGGMQLGRQPIVPREEEYVFRPPPALVISGKVVDAETKRPIETFQVVPGVRSSATHMNWVRGKRYTATGGEYRIRHVHDHFAHLLRIEANGYLPAVARDIQSNEGNVSIDFELVKGNDVAATVFTPTSSPAAGAKIALGVAGSQINVTNGDMGGGTYAAQTETDAEGRFSFPPREAAFQLIITHPAGYAQVKATPESMPPTIDLVAWARVEGIFRIGKNPVADAPITIHTAGLHSYGDDVPNIFAHYDVTTGKDGRFVFPRVVAGEARIGRRIMLTVSDGAAEATSSCKVVQDFPSGETTRVELGGTGRPVVGRLQASERFAGRVNWNFGLIEVESDWPKPPTLDEMVPDNLKGDPDQRSKWIDQWQQTEAGRAWAAAKFAYDANQPLREASPRFSASVGHDGTFRIDDMPAGDYSLSIWFSRNAAGALRGYRFSVPPMPGNRSQEELDLGVLALE